MSNASLHYVALQNAVIARLESTDPSLAPALIPANGHAIPFLSEQRGDLVNKIQNAVAKIGLVVIVLTPKAIMINPNAPGLDQMAPILVQVQETGIVNKGATGSQISALEMVVFVMKRIHFWSHDLYAAEPDTMRVKLEKTPFVLINDNPTVYNVAAWTPISLNTPLKS
jgi:hypothetical protein